MTMQDLNSLLGGKTVAIVGSSPHLEGTGLGSRIDSHEVVIRINDCSPRKRTEDFGSRTTLLSLNLGSDHLEEYRQLLGQELDHNSELKGVLCPGQSWDTEPRWKKLRGSVSKNFESLGKKLPLITVEDERLQSLESEVGGQPTTGLATIALVLDSNAKQIFICGFSFYSTTERYSREKTERQSSGMSAFSPPTGHKPWLEVAYLRRKLNDRRVSFDSMFASLVEKNTYKKPSSLVRMIWFMSGALKGAWMRLKIVRGWLH